MEIKILHGDNIAVLKTYPDNYFDSVVTDGPYGMGNEPDPVEVMKSWIEKGYHEIKGKGFMGNDWDAFVPQPATWREIYRVLKPGGHVLSFASTRTYDWMVMSLRFAGFEIRDMISWIYGSGFPKSLDVSKAIDNYLGAERKIISEVPAYGIGGNSTFNGHSDGATMKTTAPATAESLEWDGWGTALKPATEPICVARKPLIGTVAENILTHSTGGINIDACRIEYANEKDQDSATWGTGTNIIGGNYVGSTVTDGRKNIKGNQQGRFPANVIFDPVMAAELDIQSGTLKSGSGEVTRRADNNVFASGNKTTFVTYGDTGGASRFFYVAKPSKAERNAGLGHLSPDKTSDGRLVECDNAFQRAETQRHNIHPTVKPITLMRYLIRLVTPKGGHVLDPYAGSGTTGCAAAFEEVNITLIERDDKYLPLIDGRTEYWSKEAEKERRAQQIKNSQLAMF